MVIEDSFKSLKFKQIITVCWWSVFNSDKFEKYYFGLIQGLSPKFTFIKANE